MTFRTGTRSRHLLARVEAEAAGKNGSSGTESLGREHRAMRGDVCCRRHGRRRRRPASGSPDIIAEASDGKLSLDGLKESDRC